MLVVRLILGPLVIIAGVVFMMAFRRAVKTGRAPVATLPVAAVVAGERHWARAAMRDRVRRYGPALEAAMSALATTMFTMMVLFFIAMIAVVIWAAVVGRL